MTLKKTNKTKTARLLGLSRSSLYYRPKQLKKDWALKAEIEEALHNYPSYGHKRLAIHLKINKKRALRVMRLFGVKPYRRRGRRWRKTKNLSEIYPNLLLKTMPQYPNHIWASDFTRLNYKGKVLHLATVIDILTREIVGLSVSVSHGAYLTINALLSALNQRPPPEIIHSDQGSEYKSKIYTDLAESLGIKVSMSRKASPWENGYQEAFYSQFKIDLGDPNRFESLGELIAEIYQTIHIYNTQRIHSVLKTSPRNYAMLYSLKQKQLTKDTSSLQKVS
jgi:putative transposase